MRAEKCIRSRPKAKTYACVSENAPDSLSLFISFDEYSNDEKYSHSAIGQNLDGNKFTKHKQIKVKTRILNSILEEESVESIDLLTIDVEGTELEVL